ncbi:MAG: transcriptional repressor [Microbacteriaceae bacterium]|nr:transcriptional repressor [Microbacteriaceae bacterium]MCI1206826.1 transcriptional repressor [Microbacteriaceae bacterium]
MNAEQGRTGHMALEALLHTRGLRATPQRQLIYRIVTARRQHLSAVQVQALLEKTMPGISLPTVYATLDLFVDLGVLRKISLPSGPAIYDSGIGTPHAHLVCHDCGNIFDLDIPPVSAAEIEAAEGEGFSVDSGDLVLHGLCRDCARRERAAESAAHDSETVAGKDETQAPASV